MSKNTIRFEVDQNSPGTPHSPGCKWLKRFIIVCLFGLVIEVRSPSVLAVWYGAPTLSLTEICDEFMKVRWNDEKAECKYPHPIDGPPFGGPGEGTGRTTAKTEWVCNPNRTSTGSGSGNWCVTREREAREKASTGGREVTPALLITAQSIGLVTTEAFPRPR